MSRRRVPVIADELSALVADVLADGTHALISAFEKRRRSGQDIRASLRAAADDVSFSAVGIPVSQLFASKPKRRVVLRGRTVKNRNVRSPDTTTTDELERLAQLKKILDG